MKWSWKLVTIRGIEIKVHVTFLLVLIWGAMSWGSGGWSGAIYGTFLTLTVFVFVLLHELGHAVAAQRYNIPVHDILLLPIGGLARLEPDAGKALAGVGGFAGRAGSESGSDPRAPAVRGRGSRDAGRSGRQLCASHRR